MKHLAWSKQKLGGILSMVTLVAIIYVQECDGKTKSAWGIKFAVNLLSSLCMRFVQNVWLR